MKWWQRFEFLGNTWKAAIGVVIFLIVLITFTTRCTSANGAEVDLRTGVTFPQGGPALAVGLDLHFPQGNNLDLYAGTTMWGRNSVAANNWDWHAGFRSCRWSFCASLGAAYVQRIDALNGTHANYNLTISYILPWNRLRSVGVTHLSNSGTSAVNVGRNLAFVDWKLQ